MRKGWLYYAALVALYDVYFIACDTFHASVYHPFSVDAYHISQIVAFMAACCIGAMTWSAEERK